MDLDLNYPTADFRRSLYESELMPQVFLIRSTKDFEKMPPRIHNTLEELKDWVDSRRASAYRYDL